MKRIVVGLIGGAIGSIINILFLLLAPDLEIEVYIATGITWIAIGILISLCNFKINGILKGIMVSFLVSASSLVYTFTSSASGSIWTLINTLVVGAVIGYAIEKVISIITNKN